MSLNTLMRKIYLLITLLCIGTITVQAQHNAEIETTDELVDPASTPSKHILFTVHPSVETSEVTVAMQSYIGPRATFTLIGPSGKQIDQVAVSDCTDKTVVKLKLKTRKKGHYMVRVVTSKLKHMTSLFVL
jgi:hypothetical protein